MFKMAPPHTINTGVNIGKEVTTDVSVEYFKDFMRFDLLSSSPINNAVEPRFQGLGFGGKERAGSRV